MSDAEFKQYRDGARLLFVNQDDYKECKSIISEKTPLNIKFWGQNKFVTDRSDYPWYLYIESTNAQDLAFLRELITKYQKKDHPKAVEIVQNEHLTVNADSQFPQRELIAIENETIFQAVKDVKASIDEFDDLMLSQFGAISQQISEFSSVTSAVNNKSSENIKNLEFSIKEFLSEKLIPLMSGANDNASAMIAEINMTTKYSQAKQECVDLKDKISDLEKHIQEGNLNIKWYEEEIDKASLKYKDELNELHLSYKDKLEAIESELYRFKNGDNYSAKFADELLDKLDSSNSNISPLYCLRFIENIHGDKVKVLPSARESAIKAEGFDRGLDLLLMLNRLIVRYLPTYLDVGDNKANEVFPRKMFAPKESESTMNKHPESRTFIDDDKKLQMQRHLKLGVVANEKFTLRVHFHPDKEKKRIIIGYCGQHLPT